MLTCGIPNIDTALKEGFPDVGVVALVGSSDLYQMTVTKALLRNLAQHFNQGMVISSRFMSWATREFTQSTPNIWLFETEINEIYSNLKNLSLAQNWKEYSFVCVDYIEPLVSMVDMMSFQAFLKNNDDKLVIVNCTEPSRHQNFDLKSFLVSSAQLTLKIEEQNNKINLSILEEQVKYRKES